MSPQDAARAVAEGVRCEFKWIGAGVSSVAPLRRHVCRHEPGHEGDHACRWCTVTQQ